MKDLLYIWYDECRTVLRDKGILIFIIFVPLAYPLLYSYVYTNEVCRDASWFIILMPPPMPRQWAISRT